MKKILEIGIGYGSVSEKLFNSSAVYNAVDISNGPLEFIKHRANFYNKKVNTNTIISTNHCRLSLTINFMYGLQVNSS